MLNLKEAAVVFDGTFGGGGHSRLIAERIGRSGTLIACDRDGSVFETEAAREIEALTTFIPRVANFRDIKHTLAECRRERLDAALFDLGLSSTELEASGRGFSFLRDEPLLMTYEREPGPGSVTARTVVNDWSEHTLADVLEGFGEERYARRIARAIVAARNNVEIRTTAELVAIIKAATPPGYHHRKTHLATRTFQAIRMAVNDELGAIAQGLSGTLDILRSGGRIAVITFHSVEDRLVKRFFRAAAQEGRVALLTKKPIVPIAAEIVENSRSRSAKLRVVEKR